MSRIDLALLPELTSRRLLGGRVAAISDDGRTAEVVYRPPAEMLNPNGSVQGGFVTAMLDDAAGVVTWYGGGERPFTSTQLSVNFVRPTPPDAALHARARVVHAGRRQALVQVELLGGAQGPLLAQGSLVQLFL